MTMKKGMERRTKRGRGVCEAIKKLRRTHKSRGIDGITVEIRCGGKELTNNLHINGGDPGNGRDAQRKEDKYNMSDFHKVDKQTCIFINHYLQNTHQYFQLKA